ncbi:putative transcription factor [Canna indica]|uniref:Transcription factor n=1 Tax=Canna indica TaxID=4628 RepID=A0AAQ3JU14_9LILI|nr:putative transcription factor [Canna indica]
MSTAEEAAQERAVFEGVEGFDDDDDIDDSEDDEDVVTDGQAAQATSSAPPHPQPQAAPIAGDLNASANVFNATNYNPIANPSHNPSDLVVVAAPLNGAIPVQVLSASGPAAAPAASSDANLFTPSSSSVPFPASAASGSEERRSVGVVSFDESRRLFQRLWTDEEEIKILQGFFEFTSKRGTTFASHQYDTGPFYEEIKRQLQFEFTKNQLIEKLRRLKKKYRNCVSRMRSMGKDFTFKSAHERAIYDISRNIWSASVKRAHESDDEYLNTPSNTVTNEIFTVPINEGSFGSDRRMSRSRRRLRRRMTEEAAGAAVAAVGGVVAGAENPTSLVHTPSTSAAEIPSIIEETVKSCLSPLFKELINSAIGGSLAPGLNGGASPLNLLPLSIGGSPFVGPGAPEDDKWRKQQIMELEVYLKRIELVRDHIKSTLEELKSVGG